MSHLKYDNFTTSFYQHISLTLTQQYRPMIVKVYTRLKSTSILKYDETHH